jgi:hypothetical protein
METAFASGLIKYFELLAGIVGILCWHKKPQSVWFAFAVFLVFLFGLEFTGMWLGKQKMYTANAFLYKWIVVPLLFIVYHWVFYKILGKKIKPFVVVSGALLLVLTVLENTFLGKLHFYSASITVSIYCAVLLVFCLIYFYSLIRSPQILHFKSEMAFWFCLGVVIFYVGSFPYLTYYNTAADKPKLIYVTFRWIFIVLNYIMYFLFAIGFLCSRPKT